MSGAAMGDSSGYIHHRSFMGKVKNAKGQNDPPPCPGCGTACPSPGCKGRVKGGRVVCYVCMARVCDLYPAAREDHNRAAQPQEIQEKVKAAAVAARAALALRSQQVCRSCHGPIWAQPLPGCVRGRAHEY